MFFSPPPKNRNRHLKVLPEAYCQKEPASQDPAKPITRTIQNHGWPTPIIRIWSLDKTAIAATAIGPSIWTRIVNGRKFYTVNSCLATFLVILHSKHTGQHPPVSAKDEWGCQLYLLKCLTRKSDLLSMGGAHILNIILRTGIGPGLWFTVNYVPLGSTVST